MSSTAVRYIVDDVDAAIAFYKKLGFDVAMHPGPGFAMLQREGLRLNLNTPGGGGGAGQQLDDGSTPAAGGWNRFQLEVDDLDASRRELESSGVTFRGSIIEGRGGRQTLAEDPAGNLVELFEPAR